MDRGPRPVDAAPGQGDMREVMLALRRARDDADRRAAETAVILDVLETLLRPLPPARMVLRVLRVVRRILPFDDAVVLETDAAGVLRVVFATESWRLGAAWPDGPVFARARAGDVVNLADIARVPDFAALADPMLRRPGGALAIALPVEAAEGGAPLVLLRAAERGGFTAEVARTVRRLMVVARQALLSLEARRLRVQAASLAAEKAAASLALLESERRETLVRGVLEAIPVGIYLKDQQGRFRYVNGAAERIIGQPKDALLGRMPSDVLPDDIATGKEADDRALLRGDTAGPLLREMTLGTGDAAIHVEVNKSAVLLDGQRLVVATLQDVTLQRAAERAMRDAKDTAEAANRAKTEFIATVSHEIRTPLNGILGMTQALLAQSRGVEDRRALGLIRSSGDALLGLVDNILNAAKIEAGKLDLLPAEADLATALHEVSALWADRARAKGLDLVRIMDGVLPSRVRIDAVRLAQVLNNLLGNAVKFTTTGGIALRLRVQASHGDHGRDDGRDNGVVIDIAVEDTGPGIPAAARERLFRRFSQIESADGQGRPGGTGLGLSICQDLVRLMGGEITHADRPGGGSIFRFTIPVVVLDSTWRFGLPLAGQGALVLPASTTHAAWQLARAAEHLASMGAEVLNALPPAGAPQPALLICRDAAAYAALRVTVDTARHGALDAIPKLLLGEQGGSARPPGTRAVVAVPLAPASLYDAIAACLGVAPPERPLLDEPGQAPDTERLRHRRDARVLVAEDNEVNQAVARALLEGVGLRVAFAANGQQALDAVAAEPPDMVLMDLQMPVMDGLEATRRLRVAGYRGAIVACTANVLPEALAAARAAGADRVLRKPIDRGALLDLLADVLPMPPDTASPTMPRKAEPVMAQTPEGQPRSAVLMELVEAIGAEAVTEAAALFRHSAHERVAGTLQALAAGDLGAAGRHAHALKSPAAMLGADALAAAMETIERAAASRDRAGAEAAAAGLVPLLEESLAELDQALVAAV